MAKVQNTFKDKLLVPHENLVHSKYFSSWSKGTVGNLMGYLAH